MDDLGLDDDLCHPRKLPKHAARTDKDAPSHPITSSACAINSGGTGRQCLGVFKLTTRLNLVVGRSAGFSPLKILEARKFPRDPRPNGQCLLFVRERCPWPTYR
jgi:hypothetical protein